MNFKIHTFLSLILVFISFSVFAKNFPAGSPFIKNYSPKEYGASSQNWAIVQDNRGIMYLGNSSGVLEYDGVSWRLIKTKDNAVVRSLAKDRQGKIYVGTFGDFGYLNADSTGTLHYQSLKDRIPAKYQEFADIWNIHIIKDKVYFKSYKYLFELFDNRIRVIKPEFSEFNESHIYNDTLYIEYWQLGLGKLIGDSIELVITKDNFAEKYPGVGILLPYENEQILLGNPNSGLYVFDGKKVTKFKNEVDEYLIKNESYHGIRLPNDRFAFSTINGGVVVMNKNGIQEQIIDKNSGLANNTIWQLYVDNQNSLWMATDNGISHVEFPSAITIFNEYSEGGGTITQILRFDDELYLGTNSGLFYLENNETKKNMSYKFKGINGLNETIWSLLPINNEMLVGTNSGIFKVKNHQAISVREDNSVFLLKSRIFSNRIYIGLIDGLASMHFENGKWIDDGKIEGINEYINNRIVETDEGDLWLGHYQGIIHIDFRDKFSRTPAVTKYNEDNGLPSNNNNYVFSISGKILFATSKGIFRFDESRNEFMPDSTFGLDFANGSRSVFTITKDAQNKIWIYSNNEIIELSQITNGGYSWNNIPFLRLSDFNISVIYPDPNEVVWFGGPDGLFQYNSKISKNYKFPFSAIVRNVSTQSDSVLYGGFTSGEVFDISEFEYSLNALRFEFSLPSYDNEKANRFQYFLEGFDKKWSQWTSEPKAIYTNIPEGRYLFRVKAKNIYNIVSKEATYAFMILPPWYRSGWAYSIYGILIIGVVIGLIKLRSYKLENEKKELEKIIGERTDEIQIKNKQLEEQAIKLLEMDEIKSRFFANISHELRTPLTLIKGPTEELVNKTYPGDKEKALNSILINTKRMLNLINELLDLSKLESGSMKLNASLHSLSGFMNHIINLFTPLAEGRKIHFQFVKSQEDIKVYFDWEKQEKILINLLSNAFKFTPENGYITVAFQKIDSNLSPDGAVEISIHDSGIGIPENEISQIFNRFIQAQNSGNTRLEGSGIGLALAKELVELHRGQIKVTSFVNEGTEFDIILPLGKVHLQADEIKVIEVAEKGQQSSGQLDITGLESELSLQPADEQQIQSGEKCLVLIVEDNNEVRDYIKEHLKKDYEIVEANDGRKGLNLANEFLPDLIVSDVMMPEMDGFELADTLKKNELTNHIPIILLTAKASDEAKIEGLETGADAYMSKPFNAKELEVRVKNLIESRHGLREKFKKEYFSEPSEINAVSLDDEFIKRVHDTIEEKMSDPDFNVDLLLKDFPYGQRQFTRKVIALTGQTPVQFIRIMRLKKALNLIKQRAGTVSQIAYDVGFSNLSYFSKCFRSQFGKLPSEIL